MKKKVLFIFSIILLLMIGAKQSRTAQASSYLNGNDYARAATRYVKVTRKIPIYRVRTGKYEAQNHFYKAGYVKKGTKLHISYWIMSTGGWIVTSKKYYHNSRTFFIISARHADWYKKI
ncbi:hypothetical protein [Lactobacillus sp.]|uniref:hypothetical protein n=1 Tax=Lactobacillus sp. TaxID=1591 RepID=UPI0019855578|nr:hypothetical protein [Lactobacillus sp.]MBD5429244.1 hypothetical protein [Lactobacillus sp.]